MAILTAVTAPHRLQLTALQTLAPLSPFERLTEISWLFDPARARHSGASWRPKGHDGVVFRSDPGLDALNIVGRLRLTGHFTSELTLVPLSVRVRVFDAHRESRVVARADTWLISTSSACPSEVELGQVVCSVAPGHRLELELSSPTVGVTHSPMGHETQAQSRQTLHLGGLHGACLIWD